MNELQLAQQLQEASRPTELPPTPSFEPWLIRIRTLRAGVTCAAMLVTTLALVGGGTDWVDAVLQGMAASVVSFFIAWACALWICSELYSSEVRRARTMWADRERDRQQQIRDLYRQRMDLLHGTGVIDDSALDNLIDFHPPAAANGATTSSPNDGMVPNAWQQVA